MRFLTCGADSILVELADLDETLRVFAALQSAVKHAVEQTAESPERAAQPSTTSVFAGVKQLIPAARTVYVAFDPLLSSRVELTAAIRALNVAADMERHSRIVEIPVIYARFRIPDRRRPDIRCATPQSATAERARGRGGACRHVFRRVSARQLGRLAVAGPHGNADVGRAGRPARAVAARRHRAFYARA